MQIDLLELLCGLHPESHVHLAATLVMATALEETQQTVHASAAMRTLCVAAV